MEKALVSSPQGNATNAFNAFCLTFSGSCFKSPRECYKRHHLYRSEAIREAMFQVPKGMLQTICLEEEGN